VGAPASVVASRLFEFTGGPGLSALLISVHPLHAFSDALGQLLTAEHTSVALGTVDLRDLVVTGPALRFVHEGLYRCGAPSRWGVVPGYCLFRQGEMLAWDSGLPRMDDVHLVARGAVVGAVWSAVERDPAVFGEALRQCADYVAAARVAARFREAASAPKAQPREERQWTRNEPRWAPPIEDLAWAYAQLGIGASATDEAVHQAWRQRRMACHPDYAVEDPVEFARRSRLSADINRAREIIVKSRR
jgi:hypothetical protein